ncbi:uncharacterized protein LOC111704388 [Eurytemora carolleeae]|uniref:uncharacterized protein LOC111704388 n=1 Tax=Eurytemora carolleeae TaxID=1294199 RepID=UPI000C77CBC2|nr:uncharacterized protein LOC111704388 [Eurytemora carolleeae]|eukprot:XP_023332382.1 uncharacterized protein LOC111704388 [Eurytemora affinis]
MGAKQTVLRELKSLENEVCYRPGNSLHLLPFKLKTPELRKSCSKLQGRLHGYSVKDEFDRITKLMTLPNSLKVEDCRRQTDNTNTSFRLSTFLANTDEDREGFWTNMYNKSIPTEYFSWMPNRPYAGTDVYNCMTLNINFKIIDGTENIASIGTGDEECAGGWEDCGICQVPTGVVKIRVRGLCMLTRYDQWYLYNINKDGTPIFRGTYTSSIIFNRVGLRWEWYDRTLNTSIALIQAPLSSLLLGLQTVDFSNAFDGKCIKDGEPFIRQVKFTTCVEGQFTCNNGHCIDIEERCDQTSNCSDESDEENCR